MKRVQNAIHHFIVWLDSNSTQSKLFIFFFGGIFSLFCNRIFENVLNSAGSIFTNQVEAYISNTSISTGCGRSGENGPIDIRSVNGAYFSAVESSNMLQISKDFSKDQFYSKEKIIEILNTGDSIFIELSLNAHEAIKITKATLKLTKFKGFDDYSQFNVFAGFSECGAGIPDTIIINHFPNKISNGFNSSKDLDYKIRNMVLHPFLGEDRVMDLKKGTYNLAVDESVGFIFDVPLVDSGDYEFKIDLHLSDFENHSEVVSYKNAIKILFIPILDKKKVNVLAPDCLSSFDCDPTTLDKLKESIISLDEYLKSNFLTTKIPEIGYLWELHKNFR